MRKYFKNDTQKLRKTFALFYAMVYNVREEKGMTLKELRLQKGLTQAKCAEYLGVPLRTYQNYEKNEEWGSSIKAAFMFARLERYGFVDEEHGILTVEQITETCERVFEGLGIEYCYLFGSYAKGTPTEKSDVDLLVATDLSGMIFYALIENLREELKKKVDLITTEQLNKNPELLNEILKYGIKIYG